MDMDMHMDMDMDMGMAYKKPETRGTSRSDAARGSKHPHSHPRAIRLDTR